MAKDAWDNKPGTGIGNQYKLLAKQPIDARYVAVSIAERDLLEGKGAAYLGLEVWVEETQKKYRYLGTPNNWQELTDLSTINSLLDNYVTLSTTQAITGFKTFKAPSLASGEQATVWFETANGGRIGFGKEGPNSGTGIFFEQKTGTRRLNFRASAAAGAIVWSQPEPGAKLYFDLGGGPGYNRIVMPTGPGTLALTKDIGKGTITIKQEGISDQSINVNQSDNKTITVKNTTYHGSNNIEIAAGNILKLKDSVMNTVLDPTETGNFRKTWFGDNINGHFFRVIRSDDSNYTDYYPRYGSGITWADSDTHGYLYTSYSQPIAYIGGGNNGLLTWKRQLAFTSDLITSPNNVVDNAVVIYNGTTGKQIKNSTATIINGVLNNNFITTGSGTTSYFQSRRFRGQGDAASYYHAIDFGYAGHDQVDFYEYGGTWNFWQNKIASATSDKNNLALSIKLIGLEHKNQLFTWPDAGGCFATREWVQNDATAFKSKSTVNKLTINQLDTDLNPSTIEFDGSTPQEINIPNDVMSFSDQPKLDAPTLRSITINGQTWNIEGNGIVGILQYEEI